MILAALALSPAALADDAPLLLEVSASHRRPPPRERRPPPRREAAEPRTHHLSLTIDLVDLPGPLVTGGAELALTPRASLVGHGGLGGNEGIALYEIGADVRGYFAGDFDRGLYVSGGIGLTNAMPLAPGLTATTYEGDLGGKVTLPVGLTLEGAVGLAAYTAPELGVLSPTLKVGVGWSF